MMKNNKLAWLIGLTAATMAAQYALQGWLALGESPDDLPAWFRTVDTWLWIARALIEASVIFYLFATPDQSRLITTFEIVLISLVTLTLGPVFVAVGQGGLMAQTLPPLAYWFWSFAIASYAPLMIAAAGYAYRVRQSEDSKRIDPVQVSGESVQAPYSERIEPKDLLTEAVNDMTTEEKVLSLWNSGIDNYSEIERTTGIDRRKVSAIVKRANNGTTTD